MLKEQISFLDEKFPSLSNSSKMRMLKLSNEESKTLYSLVDDKIIEMPIYSEAKNRVVNYLYSVLSEDNQNQVEKFPELFQGETNKISFDLAANFDEKKEYKILSHPHAYFVVAMNNKEREFYLKIFENLREMDNEFYYVLIDYSAKIVFKIKANVQARFELANCVEIIHESKKKFKINNYEFDMKCIFK
ncbi:MAG: hypothetical protein K2X69_02350 [Silvanigrellaceae bacterium]|nr:hypothetical protein [Silvanigrellaceae bacterium]